MTQLPYSDTVKKILQYSKEEAIRLCSPYIEPEHIMLGIIRDAKNSAYDAMHDEFSVDIPAYRVHLESAIRSRQAEMGEDAAEVGQGVTFSDGINFSEKAAGLMRIGQMEAKMLRCKEIEPQHLLLGILKQSEIQHSPNFLNGFSLTYGTLKASLSQPTPATPHADIDFDDEDEEDDMPPSGQSKHTTSTQKTVEGTPAIDTFGTDITKAAAEGKLDPVVGREKEIERIAQILARRKKNNPILIGEPGVGKSAIVEGLAIRINEHKVPRTLFDKRIISLDLANVVAGTKYRGQFEERMRTIINELVDNPDIIIFIDEIHSIIGAGNQAGQMDAANMMKPALSRGQMQCIGATTLDEYRKSIEKDGALERRFQKILVEPTSSEETLTILHNIKDRYEAHHNVCYTDDALEACVRLTNRYITDRQFPDKAIDALDESGSRIHIGNISVPKEIELQEQLISEAVEKKNEAVKAQNYEQAASFRDAEKHLRSKLSKMKEDWEAHLVENRETVDAEKVAETVSVMTGIPVQKMAMDEGIRLKGMRQDLKNRVIAQDGAIDKLVSAIQRSRIGLKDPARPIGVFMFLGPTGVGKTYLAKKLAEHMFGSADALVRVDMSEYMEKFTVSRLVGAPPGYVGYEEGGMLTEKVRRKPYSIVLLDEIEKAHADVFNILLQVMDDGRLTDSNGRTVDFRNTVIIMTSNVGTRQLKDFGRGIGFSAMEGKDDKEVSRSVIQKALNRQFSPEFLNRIDEIITFDQLDLKAILQIIDLELKELFKRVDAMGYTLQISPEAKEFIANKGYDKQFGARPLRRAIQQYLEDPLSEKIVEEEPEKGSVLEVILTDGDMGKAVKIVCRK